jgi:hypothetical protein
MEAKVAAWTNNIMTGQDPITPKTESSKEWYEAMKSIGIYDNKLIDA